MFRAWATLAFVAGFASSSPAGVHFSGDSFAELPSRWSGFLVDHRSLRAAAIEKPKDGPQSPLRETYLEAVRKLKDRAKTADELADLGALYVRLGRIDSALDVLRPAARAHPDHFRLAANLGTAWQLAGDLDQAAAALDDAIRLAPAKLKPFEEYHRKLIRLRSAEGKAKPEAPDDLFGGRPPENAAAIVQYLALALPADGRLLWQLGEIAFAHGEAGIAAAILDGCVAEFGLGAKSLRENRQKYRAIAEERNRKPEPHPTTFVAKSPRPLRRSFDASRLPPIRDMEPNPLPWALVAGATVDARTGPKFPEHLRKLDGKPVELFGYIQPVGDAAEFRGFMLIEYPVGCWFCETPDPTALIGVELAPGLKTTAKRTLVRITGTLALNRDDPEDFLFRVTSARIRDPE